MNKFEAFYLSTFYKQSDFNVNRQGNVIIPTDVCREIGISNWVKFYSILDQNYSDNGFNDNDDEAKLYLDNFGKKV